MSEQAHLHKLDDDSFPEVSQAAQAELDTVLLADVSRVSDQYGLGVVMEGIGLATRFPTKLRRDVAENAITLRVPAQVARVALQLTGSNIARRILPTEEESATLSDMQAYRHIRRPWTTAPRDRVDHDRLKYEEFLNRRLALLAILRYPKSPPLKSIKGGS